MKWGGYFLILALALGLFSIPPVVSPVKAASASYYFSPSSIKLNAGQSATVTLYLSSPDQAINAGDGTVVLPSSYVSGSSVSKSGSIFTNWPEEPGLNGANIRFAGGLPTPGYRGTSGKILSFSIKGNAEGTGLITMSGGRILANDASSTNIYSGTSSATVAVTRIVRGATISSATHPDQNKWYKTKDASLSWTKPSGASSYSYTLSHDGGQATKTGSGGQTSATFSGLADGIWTFSLTTTFSDGKTAGSSYTIRVDTTPPVAFTFTCELKNGLTDQFPVLAYQTTDTPSGLDHYEIIVDAKEPIITSEATYKLPKQQPGTHKLTIRAVDKAGNTTDSVGSFTIEGFPGPTITDYPRVSPIFQPLHIKGTALFGAKVQLYVDGHQVVEFIVKEHLTEKQRRAADIGSATAETVVEWEVDLKNGLMPGKHSVYATQSKEDGAESNPSNEISIRILADSVQLFGIIIPLWFIIIGLVILLLILIAIFIWLWKKVRLFLVFWKRRKKQLEEVVEEKMQVLVKDLEKKAVPKSSYSADVIEEEVKETTEEIDEEIDKILGDSKEVEKKPIEKPVVEKKEESAKTPEKPVVEKEEPENKEPENKEPKSSTTFFTK